MASPRQFDAESHISVKSSATSIRSLRKRRLFFGRGRSGVTEMIIGPTDDMGNRTATKRDLDTASVVSKRSMQRRSKSDPFEGLRTSFFGMRRPHISRDAAAASTSSSPLDAQSESTNDSASPQRFDSDEDDQRCSRLRSISAPFNFQHVSHKPIPECGYLETVEESDAGEQTFVPTHRSKASRDSSTHRRKRQHRQMSITEAPFAFSRPITPPSDDIDDAPQSAAVPAIDAVRDDGGFRPESTDTQDDVVDLYVRPVLDEPSPDDEELTLHEPYEEEGLVGHLGVHLTELSIIDAMARRDTGQDAVSSISYIDDRIGVANTTTDPQDDPTTVSADPSIEAIPHHVVEPPYAENVVVGGGGGGGGSSFNERRSDSAIIDPALSPFPTSPYSPYRTRSKVSSRTPSIATSSSNSLTASRDSSGTSATSNSSSRYSCGVQRSAPSSISLSDEHAQTLLNDASWEDYIDFCYEQEAESTCDFNWKNVAEANPGTVSCISQRGSSSTKPSPSISEHGEAFPRRNQSSDSMYEQSRMQLALHHQRGSSVGHRGFLASRKQSADLRSKTARIPEPLGLLHPPYNRGGALSPVPSIRGEDLRIVEPLESPLIPSVITFSRVDETLRVRDDENATPTQLDAISYADNVTAPTTHTWVERPVERSVERSLGRPVGSALSLTLDTTASTPSLKSAPRRTSSTPESGRRRLRHRRQASTPKASISRPFHSTKPSLSSPGSVIGVFDESTSIVPSELQTLPIRTDFTIRRPETPEDRALLQLAGRASQRGRPMSPPLPAGLTSPISDCMMSRRPARIEPTVWV